MSLDIRIERLVLEGLDVSSAEARRIGAALESELTRLLASGRIGPELAGGGLLPSLRVPDVTFAPPTSPAALGASLAEALGGGLLGPLDRSESVEQLP